MAAVLTPAVVARIGHTAALITAHFTIAIGLFLLLPTGTEDGIGWYIAATAIAGIGYGISFSVVADIAVAAVPPERAGSAAALAETGNELGNALGIALFGSLAAALFRLNGPDLAPTLTETLHLPALTSAVLNDARSAFVDGLHVVATTAAILHTALGLAAIRVLRGSAFSGARSRPFEPTSAELGHARRDDLGDVHEVVGRRDG